MAVHSGPSSFKVRTLATAIGGVIAWFVLGSVLSGIVLALIAGLRRSLTRSQRTWAWWLAGLSIFYGHLFAMIPWWLAWLYPTPAT